MTYSKLNLLILPLLFSILLATASKLKVGRTVDLFTYAALSPIQIPISSLKHFTDAKISFMKNMPQVYQENQTLKKTNSTLLSENQSLKNLIQDKSILENLKSPYKSTLPIRVVSIGNQITATTALDIDQLNIGQPVISGSTIIGVVSTIKKPIITITPLTNDNFSNIQIKTSLGQSGIYQYSARTPQIINIPSENPVSLNDTVFTQASCQFSHWHYH